jgi:photosystem II stability/assembly factor-like uncharacterized protein
MTSPVRCAAVIFLGPLLCGPVRAERLVLASASYGNNIIAICDADGKVLWAHQTAGPKTGHSGHHDIQLLENGNILFHENWKTIIEMTLDRKVVWRYDSSKMNGNQGKAVEVHAFQRLPGRLTMIAESGVGRIIEVDSDGKIHAEIKLKPGGTQHTRMVRKLANGNYLVCAEHPGVVTEYNPNGEVVWEYATHTRVYGAIRLKSGHTLIASGSGASVVEVTPAGTVAWEIKNAIPDAKIMLKWTTFLTELDNGNFIVGNCHAGDKSPQIFEITRAKKVVWQFNAFATFGNGLACSQVLDDKQSALVRKLLATVTDEHWQQQTIDSKSDFRGLSVVNAKVAWVSGTNGTFGRTADGGKTWVVGTVPGADQLDFRDVEAFGEKTAYLLSAGPGDASRIYKTVDAGKSWVRQFKSGEPASFVDAIAFWDENTGIALGDPVAGRFQLLVTSDGGVNWKPLPATNLPPSLPGEGAFAASGTCLVTHGKEHVWFVTGGAKVARVFRSSDRGQTWQVSKTPIRAGTEAAGIFSIAFRDEQHGMIVGGDYRKPKETGATAAITSDGGKTWKLVDKRLPYCSAVAWAKDRWVAVGTAGSHASLDHGDTWKLLDHENYHSVGFTVTGEGWAAGPKGRVARFAK